jgi:hypothetical protein
MAKRIHDLVLGSDTKSKPTDFSRMKYSFYVDHEDPDIPRQVLGNVKKSEMADGVLKVVKDALHRRRSIDHRRSIDRGDEIKSDSDDSVDIFADAGREYEFKVSPESKAESKALFAGDAGGEEKANSSRRDLFLDDTKLEENKDSSLKDNSHLLQRLEDDHEFFNTEIIDESDDDFEREFGGGVEKVDGEEKKFDTEEEYTEYLKTIKKRKSKGNSGKSKKKQKKNTE